MSDQAILRFWTLVACVSYFLDEQRAAQNTLQTWGEARRAIQREHQRNLVSWIGHQFQSGATAQQICAQLAL